jgi:hypothetical protein
MWQSAEKNDGEPVEMWKSTEQIPTFPRGVHFVLDKEQPLHRRHRGRTENSFPRRLLGLLHTDSPRVTPSTRTGTLKLISRPRGLPASPASTNQLDDAARRRAPRYGAERVRSRGGMMGCRSIDHSPIASVQKQRRRPPPRAAIPGRPRHGTDQECRRVVFPGCRS